MPEVHPSPRARPSRRRFVARLADLALVTLLGGTVERVSPHASSRPVALAAAAAAAPLPEPRAGARPTAVPAARQPNVVLVTIDTLRADRLGSSGFAAAHTPTLDQIAREGTRCARAVCQLPQTDPSHVALMTGLYPSTSGVKVHMVDKLAPGSQTLARVFAGAGYRTAGFYSWVSFDPEFCGLNQGFQTYEGHVVEQASTTAGKAPSGAEFAARRTADLTVNKADPDILGPVNGRADVTTDRALAWLSSAPPSHPFFLWVHYFDPHSPYSPPPGYDHLFGLPARPGPDGSLATLHAIQSGALAPDAGTLARLGELYQGEIAYVDAQLGRLVGALRARDLLDDTILVVTGDHGESFGEHDDWLHGLTLYESEIHVPLLLRDPRQVPAGAVITSPVQLVDVFPTLLELTGLNAARDVQGASLVPLLRGQSGPPRVAFTELADDSFVAMLTTPEWKLIRDDATGELQLYRLDADAAEQVNLARQQPTLARELAARLRDRMSVAGRAR